MRARERLETHGERVQGVLPPGQVDVVVMIVDVDVDDDDDDDDDDC